MKASKFIVLIFSMVTLGLVFTASVHANILSGSYSYDSASDLYTYSYSLDNTYGSKNITVLTVYVSNEYDSYMKPLGYTSPPSWDFWTAIGGNCSTIGCGTSFQWYDYPGLSVGSSLSGFSFTTQYAPSSSTSNNYGVYANGYIEYGHIVAPDIPGNPPPPPVVPEPISSILFVIGGTLLAGKRLLRRKA